VERFGAVTTSWKPPIYNADAVMARLALGAPRMSSFELACRASLPANANSNNPQHRVPMVVGVSREGRGLMNPDRLAHLEGAPTSDTEIAEAAGKINGSQLVICLRGCQTNRTP
jgi:hypothetical protein